LILIGLGANLPSRYGAPEETLGAAVAALAAVGLKIVKVSSIWRSAPVPVSEQSWYCNAVVEVDTGSMSAAAVLALLQDVENDFGRVRAERNAPRVLDLDLLVYHDEVYMDTGCIVPHPRMHQRAFVLKPLQEIAPTWKHPVLGLSVGDLIEKMPEGQGIEILQILAA